MKGILIFLALLAMAGGMYLAFGLFDGGGEETGAADGPGASEATEGAGPAGGLAAYDVDGDGVVYQDGMHPWYVQDTPGTAPDCGMDLTPVRVAGREEGTVTIDPVTLQNTGVRTAPVTLEALGRTVRTTGRFEASEQGLAAVSPRIGGWVEKLHVDYEGARVRRGQPLLDLYSPELVSTQEEYLLALRNAERLNDSPDAQRLVEAARRRLAYWDVSEAQIAQLEERGTPQRTLTLHAPVSGTVTMKNVVVGQQITPGQTLLQLADLSRLWLLVDVYEQDLAWVNVGTEARIELPYEPGRTLTGRVDYLYDVLDPQTRTIRARVTVPNPGQRLKPGMYATVYLTGGLAEPRPVVPEEALIRTGADEVVILALGEGRFRPVPVTAGVAAEGRVQILEGLQGGEEIVTSAQFLIDSEARLQSALGSMVGMGMAGDPGPNPTAGEHDHPAPPTAPPAPPAPDGVQTVHLTVGASGFTPNRLTLRAGVPARLVFTRTADGTCARQVRIPAFGIPDTELPLNEPVVIEFTPGETGSFTYACGMDMLKGTLVVTPAG